MNHDQKESQQFGLGIFVIKLRPLGTQRAMAESQGKQAGGVRAKGYN